MMKNFMNKLINNLIIIFNIIIICNSLSTITTSNIKISNNKYTNSNKFSYNHIKTLKLPVWPIVGGVLTALADFLPNKAFVEGFLNSVGGRVIPISLSISPFLLLVHHTHSFTSYDPFRSLTKIILPEGFPAHPHAGFDTVTYCLTGGLKHRDSEGCKMAYGDGDIQWMRAGKGIIHEEMWNINNNKQFNHQNIELFQLWVNLPKKMKENDPIVKVIPSQTIPIVSCGSLGETCKVLSGQISYNNEVFVGPGNDIAGSEVTILHMNIPNIQSTITLTFDSKFKSIIVYIRRGSIIVNNESINLGDIVVINPNESNDTTYELSITSGERGCDCLLLIGEPLNETVITNGPFVQISEDKINEKANVFNRIGKDGYWDYKLSDIDWLKHCKDLNLQKLLT